MNLPDELEDCPGALREPAKARRTLCEAAEIVKRVGYHRRRRDIDQLQCVLASRTAGWQ